MTLQEAATRIANHIEAQLGAIRAASQNGTPIVLPDGRSVNMKAPHPADLTISLLQGMSIMLQFMNALGGALAGGFVLTDAEAARIADLVAARLGKGTGESEADRAADLQKVT